MGDLAYVIRLDEDQEKDIFDFHILSPICLRNALPCNIYVRCLGMRNCVNFLIPKSERSILPATSCNTEISIEIGLIGFSSSKSVLNLDLTKKVFNIYIYI